MTTVDAPGLEWAAFDVMPGYAVNSNGGVFNLKRTYYLKPCDSQYGFLKVGPMVNGRQRFLYLHRLVAMAFLPDYKEGYEVLFKDGDKHNCAADNLYMGARRSRRTEDGLW